MNDLHIRDIVSFCLLDEIQARLSKCRDNFSSVFIKFAGLNSFSNCSGKRKIFFKCLNTKTYFTGIEMRQLFQQVTRKTKKFCWCLLFGFCLSLEQLLCCFIYRESYSAGNLGNDPLGHNICRSSQKCWCFCKQVKAAALSPVLFLPARTNTRCLARQEKGGRPSKVLGLFKTGRMETLV